MRICVMGLGYVGAVSAAVLVRDGHSVIGVDSNPLKVDLVNAGASPVVEPGLQELIAAGVDRGDLRATMDVGEAIASTDAVIICVGTPSQRNGDVSTAAVAEVSRQIGSALRMRTGGYLVIVRSTVPPGCTRNLVLPAIEESSGGRAGVDFSLCHNPEFLREGTAIADYDNPPKTVIGCIDEGAGASAAQLYAHLAAPLIITRAEVSELCKYVDNVWHALKVCFGNEVGNICKELAVDSHELIDIFFKDTKLNLSSYYLRPGFAFGGSCLPKDTAALAYTARSLDLELPLIGSILGSNRLQIERAAEMIKAKGKRRITLLGVSFKQGTDDLRESPFVALAEHLIGKGYDLRIYDPSVNLSLLTGANKDYVLRVLPHIQKLMLDDLGAAVDHADLVVVGTKMPEIGRLKDVLKPDQSVVDLARVPDLMDLGPLYDGVNW